ncbi:MAG: hypothetical protein R3C11_14815 [Planctomycetaceae bacterium]
MVEFRSLSRSKIRRFVESKQTAYYVNQGSKYFSSLNVESLFTDSFDLEDNKRPYPVKTSEIIQDDGSLKTSLSKTEFGVWADQDNRESRTRKTLFFPYELAIHRGSPLSTGKFSIAIQGNEVAKNDDELSKSFYYPYDVKLKELAGRSFPNHIKLTFTFYSRSLEGDEQSRNPFKTEVFYLNRQKHYLPERYERYSPVFEPVDKPNHICEVTQWERTPSGIWYPLTCLHTDYHDPYNSSRKLQESPFTND